MNSIHCVKLEGKKGEAGRQGNAHRKLRVEASGEAGCLPEEQAGQRSRSLSH